MEVALIAAALLLLLLFLAGYLWCVAWAIRDAQRRGHSGGGIVLLFWLFGPLAAFIWLIFRPTRSLIERGPEDYSDPEEALSAASRLDSLGEWDAAIALYGSVTQRWPEYATYSANCVLEIERKQESL